MSHLPKMRRVGATLVTPKPNSLRSDRREKGSPDGCSWVTPLDTERIMASFAISTPLNPLA